MSFAASNMELDATLARAESAEAEVDRLNGLLSDAYRRLRGAPKGAGAGPAPTCGKRVGLAAVGPVRLGPLSGPATGLGMGMGVSADTAAAAGASPPRPSPASGSRAGRRSSSDATAAAAAAAAGDAARLRHALADADRLGQQRAEAQAALLEARSKHAREEGRFGDLLAQVRRAAEREIAALREQVEVGRGEAGALAGQVLALQGRLAAAQADATLAAEHEAAEADRQRERARAAELSRAQITGLRTSFARELAAAQADAAGAAALRAQLQECHGKLEAVLAELQALREQAAGARQREASLVAQIVQARAGAAAAEGGRRAAEQASRLQHLQAVDRSLSSTAAHSAQLAARAGEAAITAAKQAVAEAVTVLTAPGGAAHSTRALNATVQRGRELLGIGAADEGGGGAAGRGAGTSRSRGRSQVRGRGSCSGLSKPLQPRSVTFLAATVPATPAAAAASGSSVPGAEAASPRATPVTAAPAAPADHVPLPRESVVSPLAARLMASPAGGSRSGSGDKETRQLLAMLTKEREAARQLLARQLLVQAVPAAVDNATAAVEALLGPSLGSLSSRSGPASVHWQPVLSATAARATPAALLPPAPPPTTPPVVGRRTAPAAASPSVVVALHQHQHQHQPALAPVAAGAGAIEGPPPPPTSRRHGSPGPGLREPLFLHTTTAHGRDVAASAVAVTLRPPTPEPVLRRGAHGKTR